MAAFLHKLEEDSDVLFAEEKCTAVNRGIGEELYIKNNFPCLWVIPNREVQTFECIWDHWPKKAQE